MTSQLFYSLFVVILLLTQFSGAAPRVVTKSGAVVGKEREGENGKMIYSFQGIPYIKPPVGKFRFKPPEPADPWTGDVSADNDPPMCLQKMFGPATGTEDCVVLNVYTPWDPSSSPLTKPLSVMVFIHGGGFVAGGSGLWFTGQPDYLLQHDVVLVTLNYRLDVLGFLSTGDETASGNYGLLDQVEALKWVQTNIASFGGNPDQVTIFGESAGSASVHYLMMSPLAKGLFHRAIAQSGTSLSPWGSTLTSRSDAKALAKKVGCPEEPSEDLVECLQGIDASELLNTDIVDPEKRVGSLPHVWSPRIDSEATQPFLPKHPVELMASGEYNQVPLLIGHTRTEGGLFMVKGKKAFEKTADTITNRWDRYCKVTLGMEEYRVPDKLGSELCNRLRDAYIDIGKTFQETKMQYADLIGDARFMSGIYKSSELMSKHSPVYNYLFNYESKEYFISKLLFGAGDKANGVVAHMDDLMYIFKYPQSGWTKDYPEYQMVEMITKIWTDFAKTGEPSLSELNTPWPKSAGQNTAYVVIDTHPSIQQNYRPDKMKLFEEIYSNSLYKTVYNKRDEL